LAWLGIRAGGRRRRADRLEKDTVEGMIAAVARLGEVSRQRCRDTAEARFSETTLVNEYEPLYRRLVADVAPAPRRKETAGA
jgi:hypothetical protein